MKILELTREYYPSVGGLEKFVHDRTHIYDRLGIEYSIISTDFSTEKQLQTVQLPHVTVVKQYTPYNITPSIRRYFSDDMDIVSVNLLGRYFSDRAILHYAQKRQKIILTPYFDFHTSRFAGIKRMFSGQLFPFLLDRVDAIVAFSETEKGYWLSQYRLDPDKIFVIPPFVALPSSVPTAFRSGQQFLLYLGRAGANKRTDDLLEAVLSISNTDLFIKLTIRPQDVNEKIRRSVVTDKRIELLGLVSEEKKNELLGQCDALVFPTSWESFGYVAFEASSFSKPVLCSHLPILEELHDPAGVRLFHNSPNSIAKSIEDFYRLSPQERQLLGIRKRRNVEKYTVERSMVQYQQMFDTLGVS